MTQQVEMQTSKGKLDVVDVPAWCFHRRRDARLLRFQTGQPGRPQHEYLGLVELIAGQGGVTFLPQAPEQLVLLGCDRAQGFLLSRKIPPRRRLNSHTREA